MSGIEDGDKLRWYWRDGNLSVEVIRRRSGVFEDFDGFEPTGRTDDIDRAGLEPSGEFDAGESTPNTEG